MKERTYLAIDLKSFYASVECVDRGLDPLAVNLVVADLTRTEKTICLAVSPPLKAIGVPGRPRLFEVVQQVAVVNAQRKLAAPGRCLTGKSAFAEALQKDPRLAVDYIVAPPRMARYMEYSARIYAIYLRHVAPEDIHVYSVDEVFIDATDYIASLHCTARRFAMQLILEILQETGITATAGIGSNLYLCKVAMDIVAKHIPPDSNGVRIAMLDEQSYRQQLWSYRPITDFWRVGPGYAKKLAQYGIFTMGDVARCSLGGPEKLHNEELLFRLFGVNAELLIDHAWGFESCTMADIKAYTPADHSVGSGQVLQEPYPFEKAALAVREMADALALDLVAQGLVTDRLTLAVGFDIENLARPGYRGPVVTDHYGRKVPKPVHATAKLETPTASARELVAAAQALMEKIADPALLVRRLTLTAGRVLTEEEAEAAPVCRQLDLFHDWGAEAARQREAAARRAREKKMQTAMLGIKKKYGKNAILKGMDLEDGATGRLRNGQIGGHKA